MSTPIPTCPSCQRTIPPEDFNVSTDLAFCRACNANHSLAALWEDARLDSELVRHVPGTWQRTGPRGEIVLGASHRSLGAALGALGIALFWNGIVSVFVAIALSSTLNLLGFGHPGGLPVFKSEDGPVGWGMTIFLWCFLTPFIAVGAVMIGAFFMSLAGRCVVSITPDRGTIFTGVGPFGRTRRFVPADVKRVSLRSKFHTDSDGDRHRDERIYLDLHNGTDLRFGASLPSRRKQQLAALLRQTLGQAR